MFTFDNKCRLRVESVTFETRYGYNFHIGPSYSPDWFALLGIATRVIIVPPDPALRFPRFFENLGEASDLSHLPLKGLPKWRPCIYGYLWVYLWV
jgi:hypothetical protein